MTVQLKKIIIVAALLAIIACILPWWSLFCEFIPNSGGRSYAMIISNPIYFNHNIWTFITTRESTIPIALELILSGVIDVDYLTPIVLLVVIILSLIGSIIGVLSFGTKKIALLSALLVLLGPILYIVFIGSGVYPGGIDPAYFTDNSLNAVFGTFSRNIFAHNANDYFGISIGWILCLICGLIILFAALKSRN